MRGTKDHPWLIVGLGNPGARYAHTRHNLGARIVEALRAALKQPLFRLWPALHARVSRGARLLAVPTTFMNDSGRAVALLVRQSRIPLDRVLIVHDDKDLAFGQWKLQKGRSAAGHRGVQSIIDALGTAACWRLRVGIGAPPSGVPTDAYVLHTFSTTEEQALTEHTLPATRELIAKHTAPAPEKPPRAPRKARGTQ